MHPLSPHVRLPRFSHLGFLALLILAPFLAQAAEGRWVTTWTTAPYLTAAANLPPAPLAQNTLRQFIRVSIGGELVRFRFSNAYGTSPVVIQSAHLARAAGSIGSGEIDPATSRAFRFRGAPGTVIPPGAVVYSDPLVFDLPALTPLGVSIHFGAASSTVVSGHAGSRTTSFVQTGDATTAAGMAGAARVDRWYIITGLEMLSPAADSGTVAVMGDSITDGLGSTTNGNNRWTDLLAARLLANPPTARVGVGNLGIGATGVSFAQDRLRRDVLDQTGVRWLIIYIGVNDILYNSASSDAMINNLITAYTNMANQARARGIKVYGATITPFGGTNEYTAARETARQSVNTWIRTTAISSGLFDAAIDFDAAVRDPANPLNLLPAYNLDNLHINPAGYAAMAATIDLSLFAQ